ncbi:MAG: hypothetical protein LBN09_01155 [Clostridioides sp.]|jgi:hypothetical protein|nr:hypothetical protein [Clostridioides sp.]
MIEIWGYFLDSVRGTLNANLSSSDKNKIQASQNSWVKNRDNDAKNTSKKDVPHLLWWVTFISSYKNLKI